jgi:curved DNA-binding protein CbpA
MVKASYYDVLSVPPDATHEQIKQAYRRKVRELHPDSAVGRSDPAEFARVQRAYDVLSRPIERLRYDALTGLGDRPVGARFYRRSFDRLFDSLFSGLRCTLGEWALQPEQPGRQRRAG